MPTPQGTLLHKHTHTREMMEYTHTRKFPISVNHSLSIHTHQQGKGISKWEQVSNLACWASRRDLTRAEVQYLFPHYTCEKLSKEESKTKTKKKLSRQRRAFQHPKLQREWGLVQRHPVWFQPGRREQGKRYGGKEAFYKLFLFPFCKLKFKFLPTFNPECQHHKLHTRGALLYAHVLELRNEWRNVCETGFFTKSDQTLKGKTGREISSNRYLSSAEGKGKPSWGEGGSLFILLVPICGLKFKIPA